MIPTAVLRSVMIAWAARLTFHPKRTQQAPWGGPNSCANLYMEESGFSKKCVSTRCRMVLQMSFLLMQADGIHIVVAGHEQTDVDLIHRVMYKRQKRYCYKTFY